MHVHIIAKHFDVRRRLSQLGRELLTGLDTSLALVVPRAPNRTAMGTSLALQQVVSLGGPYRAASLASNVDVTRALRVFHQWLRLRIDLGKLL